MNLAFGVPVVGILLLAEFYLEAARCGITSGRLLGRQYELVPGIFGAALAEGCKIAKQRDYQLMRLFSID
jgi:hypothetical protein